MRNLRCMIVDDEPLAVKMIETFVTRTPGIELIESFTDPVMALSKIRDAAPDLVFLDIQMPDLNGLDLSRMIPKETRIIFTTAFAQYALEGFEVNALDYLLKPIRYQKFLEAVEKAQQWFSLKEAASAATNEKEDNDSIYVKTDKVLQKVMIADILYVVGMKDYVTIYTASSKTPLVTHITMKGIEDMLPSSAFMRVHRSYIVALDKIDSIQPGMEILIGRTIIPVSDSYKDAFNEYLRKKALSL
ncbi:MAG: LytTR family DNA-binding domain-containing protein [Bacteroidales bacterium]|nr:LytTR family DNA-binding domain-containing protein [Bacteroidales bacterium]